MALTGCSSIDPKKSNRLFSTSIFTRLICSMTASGSLRFWTGRRLMWAIAMRIVPWLKCSWIACKLNERDSVARFNFWGGRLFLRAGYRSGYEKAHQLNPHRLAYYSGWAALRRLCTYGAWLTAGPGELGSKPASLGNLTQAHLDSFCRHFERHTGVPAHLRAAADAKCKVLPANSVVAGSAILD